MTRDERHFFIAVMTWGIVIVLFLIVVLYVSSCSHPAQDIGVEEPGSAVAVSKLDGYNSSSAAVVTAPPPPLECPFPATHPVPLGAYGWDLNVPLSREVISMVRHAERQPVVVAGWYCIDDNGRATYYGDRYDAWSVEWEIVLAINRQITGLPWWPAYDEWDMPVCYCRRSELKVVLKD